MPFAKTLFVCVNRTEIGKFSKALQIQLHKHTLSVSFYPRILVKPVVRAVNQLVAAPKERQVMLQCIVEAFPQPLMSWSANDGKIYCQVLDEFWYVCDFVL